MMFRVVDKSILKLLISLNLIINKKKSSVVFLEVTGSPCSFVNLISFNFQYPDINNQFFSLYFFLKTVLHGKRSCL